MEDHVERAAYNEAVFRAANEALRGSAGHARGPLLAFLCECGDEACKEKIELTGDEYAAVRAHAAHFALRPGHEGAGEYVVERRGRFSVVEKVGAARRVVE